ncbi:hypothetical protein K440DRAFT_610100 [Wilcoxina mikolae CBS 423.85]|nr:hypothetical protein K440DRAFT_610100 [Wilcoxina mikolae CBS 423.85]
MSHKNPPPPIDTIPPLIFTTLTLLSIIALFYFIIFSPPRPTPPRIRLLSAIEYKRQLEEYAHRLEAEEPPVVDVRDGVPAYWDGEGARERVDVGLRRRGDKGSEGVVKRLRVWRAGGLGLGLFDEYAEKCFG